MATILDLGILEYFTPIFVAMLVFAFVWGILEKLAIFGKVKYVNAIIAFAIAILFLFTKEMVEMVKLMTPWFTILLIILFVIILFFLFAGVKPETLGETFTSNPTVVWTIIIIVLVVFIYGITKTYGESIASINVEEGETGETSVQQKIGEIIFNPKILGMLLLLIIMGQIVRLISQSAH